MPHNNIVFSECTWHRVLWRLFSTTRSTASALFRVCAYHIFPNVFRAFYFRNVPQNVAAFYLKTIKERFKTKLSNPRQFSEFIRPAIREVELWNAPRLRGKALIIFNGVNSSKSRKLALFHANPFRLHRLIIYQLFNANNLGSFILAIYDITSGHRTTECEYKFEYYAYGSELDHCTVYYCSWWPSVKHHLNKLTV